MSGVPHGDNILWRYVGLDIVNLGENIAATRREDINQFFYVLLDFFRGGERQDMLGVGSGTPKHNVFSKLIF